jgi:hypothetical protein
MVSPMKMKEQLVDQLKTQIQDLERFIQYLHGEGTWEGSCNCACPKHPTSKTVHHSQIGHEEEVNFLKIHLKVENSF